MDPAEILALIEAAGGAVNASAQIIDQFNTWFGGVNDVKDKVRWLQISLVNLSTEHTLQVEDNWFDSGRFWSQPFEGVAPGSAITFFVCDKDGSIFTGVSGGVGVRPYKDNQAFSDDNGSWWICTFSNPYVGSEKCLTRWKGFGIKPLWEEMEEAAMVRDARCGCFMKEDKKMVFIWKNPDSPWTST